MPPPFRSGSSAGRRGLADRRQPPLHLRHVAGLSFPPCWRPAAIHAAARLACWGRAIAAISLGLVGHSAIGERFGRKRRAFSSIGAGLSARQGDGAACGYFFSAQAGVFLRDGGAAGSLPCSCCRGVGRDGNRSGPAHTANLPEQRVNRSPADLRDVLRKRPPAGLSAAASCCFHFANAAMPAAHGAAACSPHVEQMGDGHDRGLHGGTAARRGRLFSPWVGRQAPTGGGRRTRLPSGRIRGPCRSAGLLFATGDRPLPSGRRTSFWTGP